MKILFYSLWIVLLLTGCSKDKGNYAYSDIDQIAVTNEQGEVFNGTLYQVRLGDQVTIRPSVQRAVKNAATAPLFYWIIGKDTLGRTEQLQIQSQSIGVGYHTGKLVVVDEPNGLAYTADFSIQINRDITKGAYILAKQDNNETALILKGLASTDPYSFYHTLDGISFGNVPLGIDVSYQQTSTRKEYQALLVTTVEGKFPLLQINPKTLLVENAYARESSMTSGEQFAPSYLQLNNSSYSNNWNEPGIALVHGKCHSIRSGVVSGDVYRQDPLDYDFGKNAVLFNSYLFELGIIVGFDKKNERIRAFRNNAQPRALFYTENYDYLPQATMKGHQFVAIGSFFSGELPFIFQCLTHVGNEIFMDNFLYTEVIGNRIVRVSSHIVPEMINAVNFVTDNQSWYFAKGRTIYQCSSQQLKVTPFLTLPEDGSGDIVAWNFDVDLFNAYKKIGIATYNPSAPSSKKGSYYLYDVKSKKKEISDLYVIDKAVDLEICL